MKYNRKMIIAILFACIGFANAQLSKMQIVGTPEKLTSEIVVVRDANGRFCAAIQVISDIDGFIYQSYNGIVKMNDQPGKDMIYLQPDERVLEILKSGYQPLKIILSEYGIQLHQKEVWKIKIQGQAKTGVLIPITVLIQPSDAFITINGTAYPSGFAIKLSKGSHKIRISREGYKTIEETINVSDSNVYFKYTLNELELEQLTIKSVPKGARLFLNNEEKGITDYGDFFYPNRYNLMLKKSGYVDVTETINILEGLDNTFTYILKKNSGFLNLRIKPEDAEIMINQKEYSGKTNIELNPGKYDLNISKIGYLPQKKSIEIKLGETVSGSYILEKNSGTLHLKITPQDSRILINNKNYSNHSIIELPPGLKKIEVSKVGYFEQSETITIERGKRLNKNYSLKVKTGELLFKVIPLDAKVTLIQNGQEIQNWTGMQYIKDLPVGTYSLILSATGYQSFTKEVVITLGSTTKEDIRLARFLSKNKIRSKLPKKILELPLKYLQPSSEDDLDVGNDRLPNVGWLVYSDRDDNSTYAESNGGSLLTTINFMDEFLVVEENNDFIHIVQDPSRILLELSDQAIDFGWVPKSNMLLWDKCLVTKKGRIKRKAILLNTIDQFKTESYLKPNFIEFGKSPFKGSGKTGTVAKVSDIVYVFKSMKDYYLLGMVPRIPGYFDKPQRAEIIGWVPKSRITFWNARRALEPNWDDAARKERINGQKAKFFFSNFDAKQYADGKFVPEQKVVWSEAEIKERPSGDFFRFPIVRLFSRDIVLAAVLTQDSVLVSAPTTLYVKNQREPLFKEVLFLSRIELGKLLQDMFILADYSSQTGIRKTLVKNWITLIKNIEGGMSDREIEDIPMQELGWTIFGSPTGTEEMKSLTLRDIRDPSKISDDVLGKYFEEILKKTQELSRIFNSDNYQYSFLQYGFRFYWIPTVLP